jgi:peroxiredoxin
MKKRNTVQQSPKRTPKGPARRSLTIGMDLGDKSSRWCLLDGLSENNHVNFWVIAYSSNRRETFLSEVGVRPSADQKL